MNFTFSTPMKHNIKLLSYWDTWRNGIIVNESNAKAPSSTETKASHIQGKNARRVNQEGTLKEH
jgi:hypothetical protein